MSRRRCARHAAALGLAGLAGGALAQTPPAREDIPGPSLTASAQYQRDDNIFLLPDGADPRRFGQKTGARGDTILAPGLSVDENLLFGPQRVLLGVSVTRELLLSNPQFDVTDLGFNGGWNWALGGELSGKLSVQQQQSRTSFADVQSSEPNHQTSRSAEASADWRPRPDRRFGMRFSEYRGSNTLKLRRINDYRITQARAEIGVDLEPEREFTLGFTATRADYPNQQILSFAPVDNSYRQGQADFSTQFAATEQLAGDLLAGYAKRRHPDVPQRNFGGPVGRLGLTWTPSALIKLRLSVGRDLGDAYDFDRIYTVTTTTRAELTYDPTVKTEVGLSAGMRRVQYKGDATNLYTRVFGLSPYREDRYDDLKASLTWMPRYGLTLQLAQILGTRNSNEPGYQYRDWRTELDIQYRIGP